MGSTGGQVCRRLLGAAAVMALLSGCAHNSGLDPQDPLEPVNRAVYRFNDTADRYVLRPVARGYDTVTPEFAQSGVRNAFNNLFSPVTIVNQAAQGKFVPALQDLARLLINSTLGLGGLVDVARHWGLPQRDEDFGQTLGRYGVGEGWYLMLPFLGPSTNRDLLGRLVDAPLSPLYYSDETVAITGLSALDIVQTRVDLFGAETLLREQDDPYAFVRSTYLQQRQAAVRDGAPAPDDDFDALLEDF